MVPVSLELQRIYDEGSPSRQLSPPLRVRVAVLSWIWGSRQDCLRLVGTSMLAVVCPVRSLVFFFSEPVAVLW